MTIKLTLAQTCPPSEIIIVDASNEADAHRRRIETIMQENDRGEIRLIYLSSPIRSSSCQRNLAIDHATSEILFLLDDDTFMYPDCAEEILKVYRADDRNEIAGVTTGNNPISPISQIDFAKQGRNLEISFKQKASKSRAKIVRWFWREVLMMGTLQLFVPYDSGRVVPSISDVARLDIADVAPVLTMIGYAMTVRRSIAKLEKFDPWLLSYSPCEDTDATYRFSRHGMLVWTSKARLHHYQVAAARLNRHRVAALFLLNVAYLIRRHSDNLEGHRRRFFSLARRRLLAEALKDVGTFRFSFPQVAGTIYALRVAPKIFNHPVENLGPFYQEIQRQVLDWERTSLWRG